MSEQQYCDEYCEEHGGHCSGCCEEPSCASSNICVLHCEECEGLCLLDDSHDDYVLWAHGEGGDYEDELEAVQAFFEVVEDDIEHTTPTVVTLRFYHSYKWSGDGPCEPVEEDYLRYDPEDGWEEDEPTTYVEWLERRVRCQQELIKEWINDE
tara:strand:- start:246 stop:704 length:459 start_codon:yes stop_codon:yes gene_type:complete